MVAEPVTLLQYGYEYVSLSIVDMLRLATLVIVCMLLLLLFSSAEVRTPGEKFRELSAVRDRERLRRQIRPVRITRLWTSGFPF